MHVTPRAATNVNRHQLLGLGSRNYVPFRSSETTEVLALDDRRIQTTHLRLEDVSAQFIRQTQDDITQLIKTLDRFKSNSIEKATQRATAAVVTTQDDDEMNFIDPDEIPMMREKLSQLKDVCAKLK